MDVLPIKMYAVVVGYTDMPLLDDEQEGSAKIREVDVVAFHPEQGCHVLWGGKCFCLPCERVYSEPGRTGEASPIPLETLKTLPTAPPE